MSVLRSAQQAAAASKTCDALDLSRLPLVVDLEGALLATNVTVESFFIFAKNNPLQLLRVPLWLARGLAHLKQHLALDATPDVHSLPYRREVLAYLRAEKQSGRKLVLASSADRVVARRVAEETGLFDAVFASDGVINLNGKRKRARLLEEFGAGGFVYIGDGTKAGPHELDQALQRKTAGWETYLHAVRPHHWFKNALVFLPLIAAHQFYNPEMLRGALLAFVILSLCASSVYLLNDLVDLDEDRNHPQKKTRMLASGQLPVTHAFALVPVLVLAATVLCLTRLPFLLATTWAYCLLMLAYCLKLRSIPFWDAIALASGYALRVVAGSAAVNVAISVWLLGSVFFLFLGLALLKRFAELISNGRRQDSKDRVRGYATTDCGKIAVYGGLSSFVAMFGLGFYLATDSRPHTRYEIIWVSYALLGYWVARMWLMAGRGEIVSDPVSFALSDRLNRILAILMAATVLAAS